MDIMGWLLTLLFWIAWKVIRLVVILVKVVMLVAFWTVCRVLGRMGRYESFKNWLNLDRQLRRNRP